MCDLEDVHGLECLVTKPTRITDTTETLLDVILTNRLDLFKECGVFVKVLEIGKSNHFAMMVLNPFSQNSIHHQMVINVGIINTTEKLKETLSTSWHVGEMFDCVEDCYDYWIKLLRTTLQEHLPVKKMKFRAKGVPYMTTAWKSAIRAERKFAKKYSQNKTLENLELKRKWRNDATRQRRML